MQLSELFYYQLLQLEPKSGSWTPRRETPTSTNCYIWLLNPNGLYSHIYKGGPANCSKGPDGWAMIQVRIPPARLREGTLPNSPLVMAVLTMVFHTTSTYGTTRRFTDLERSDGVSLNCNISTSALGQRGGNAPQ